MSVQHSKRSEPFLYILKDIYKNMIFVMDFLEEERIFHSADKYS